MINTPPNEVRNFLHKRLFRAAKGFVSSGFNPLAAAGGFLATDQGAVHPSSRRNIPAVFRSPGSVAVSNCPPGSRPHSSLGCQDIRTGLAAGVPVSRATRMAVTVPTARCSFPKIRIGGQCVDLTAIPPGGRPFTTPVPQAVQTGGFGQTVMGQYGAGEIPGSRMIDRAVCRRGMVVGTDGICYNKSQISNKERMWPQGRRPLLTGGEMRAISIAATAAGRLTRTTKRLQKIGLMKRPTRRITAAQVHHSK